MTNSSYEKPLRPDSYRLEVAGVNFYRTIVTNLKGNSTAPVGAKMDLDVQRYLWNGKGVVAEHTGYKLNYKEDFFASQHCQKTGGTIWTFIVREKQLISH